MNKDGSSGVGEEAAGLVEQNAKILNAIEWLKEAGLDKSEIELCIDNETGKLEPHKKMEDDVLKDKLKEIYKKVDKHKASLFEEGERDEVKYSYDYLDSNYPEGHPRNNIEELEFRVFGRVEDASIPMEQRRNRLRCFEQRRERVMSEEKLLIARTTIREKKPDPWGPVDKKNSSKCSHSILKALLMPLMLEDDKIMLLEEAIMLADMLNEDRDLNNAEGGNAVADEEGAANNVMAGNEAGQVLRNGAKMSIEDIKKIDMFKDYEPGVPAKVLHLKNIAPTVWDMHLSLLFYQYIVENGRRVEIKLLTGERTGEALLFFANVDVAKKAFEVVNGTILHGKPIVIEFARDDQIPEDDVR